MPHMRWTRMHAWWDHGVQGDWQRGPWLEVTGQDTESWASDLFVTHRVVRIYAQFVLEPWRMASSGRTFRSAPRAEFDGMVQAQTFDDDCFLWWCDEPTAKISIEGTQHIENGRSYTSGPRSEILAEVTKRDYGNAIVSPTRFYFRPKDFVLNRSHPLRINLDFRVRTYLVGESEADFDVFQHDPLRIHLPEWTVYSVP